MITDRERELLPWAVLIASCAVSILTLIYVRELMRLNSNRVTSTPAGPSSAPPPADPIQINTQSTLSSTQTPESTSAELSVSSPSTAPPPEANGVALTFQDRTTPITPAQRQEALEEFERLRRHPKFNEQAARMLVAGYKPAAIARTANVSEVTVRKYSALMRRAGIRMNVARREAERIENR